MLKALDFPVISVYTKPEGQKAFRGYCSNFSHDIQQLCDILSKYPVELPILVVLGKGKENTCTSNDLIMWHGNFSSVLHWLVQHNTAYKDITLNCDCLATLPSEGIPSDLQKIYCNENVNDCEIDPDGSPLNTDEIPFNEETELTSTILSPELLNPQNQLITEELLQRPKFHWPDRNSNPLNEFRIELLAAMAFPTLIRGGKGNPTNTATMPKATQEGKN